MSRSIAVIDSQGRIGSMLTARIRPLDSRTVELKGDSLASIHEQAAAATPAGWELTDAPVKMNAGTTALNATATIVRRDGVQELEAGSFADLLAKVPEGFRLLSVRQS